MPEDMKEPPVVVELYAGPLDGKRCEMSPKVFSAVAVHLFRESINGELHTFAYEHPGLEDHVLSRDGTRALLRYKCWVGKRVW